MWLSVYPSLLISSTPPQSALSGWLSTATLCVFDTHSKVTVVPGSTRTAAGPNPYAPPFASTPTSTVTSLLPVSSRTPS